jgi:CubicO group peptidase (beta-lactamase class C family)
MRRLGLFLLSLAALAVALYGSAHLLTGSSGFARTIAWGYYGYGLGWWVAAGSRGGQLPFVARGKYGQVVAVDPAHDAVVVRLGSDDAGVD